jgi:hypothetical protein
MKVLDLHCAHQHSFEGWFSSEDDFQSQLARGLVTCPMCGDANITKMLSAPRLNLSSARGEPELRSTPSANADTTEHEQHTGVPTAPSSVPATVSPQEVASMAPAQLQAAWMQMVRHVVANTEDVGTQFSEEARKMHYGESEPRNIRGHATPEETEALLDEGIQVVPLPMPDALKGPLQ